MSGDSNGKKPDGKVRAKVPSVLLALTGIAVVAIQVLLYKTDPHLDISRKTMKSNFALFFFKKISK